MRNLANKPDPSRALQLVLPNMDEYVPGAPITPTASIPAAAYKPHWSGALHISAEAKEYAERPKIRGGGLFMPPETQILAVHNEAARLRTGVAERSIRVALIVASEWIDRAVNTSHDRNILRSCLKESNGFYSAMEVNLAKIQVAYKYRSTRMPK